MLIASYKGRQAGLRGLANVLICWRLGGDYSHSEVVFMPGDGVDHLMPDGTTQPLDGAYWCASSVAWEKMPTWSARRPGHRGGVRFKRIKIDPAKWDLRPARAGACPKFAARWFRAYEGWLYDWRLILGFVAWLLRNKAGRFICSGAVAASQRYPDHQRFDPCVLDAVHRPPGV
jgi:hypothetical protein